MLANGSQIQVEIKRIVVIFIILVINMDLDLLHCLVRLEDNGTFDTIVIVLFLKCCTIGRLKHHDCSLSRATNCALEVHCNRTHVVTTDDLGER